MNTYEMLRLINGGIFYANYCDPNFILPHCKGNCWAQSCICCWNRCKCKYRIGYEVKYPDADVIRQEAKDAYITAVISLVSGNIRDDLRHALSPDYKYQFTDVITMRRF